MSSLYVISNAQEVKLCSILFKLQTKYIIAIVNWHISIINAKTYHDIYDCQYCFSNDKICFSVTFLFTCTELFFIYLLPIQKHLMLDCYFEICFIHSIPKILSQLLFPIYKQIFVLYILFTFYSFYHMANLLLKMKLYLT